MARAPIARTAPDVPAKNANHAPERATNAEEHMTRAEYCRRPGRSSKWIRREKRIAIYIRDGFRCCYCGTDLSNATNREMGLDHLKPQCDGGSNDATNLVTACLACNSARQHRPWWTYATPGARKRIMRNRRRKLNMELAKAMLNGDVAWADC